MSDKPILFSAPMVRAILREIEQPGTGKTQTRRVLTPQPEPDMGLIGIYAPRLTAVFGYMTPDTDYKVPLRYMPRDRLYVREAWHAARVLDNTPPRDIPRDADIEHAATARNCPEIGLKGKLRPAMYLPRWASRITLIVTDVRVERLQDISEVDAVAEGIEYATTTSSGRFYKNYDNPNCPMLPVGSFRSLWNSINADRGPWESNPWVVAYTFRPILGNIDNLQEAA